MGADMFRNTAHIYDLVYEAAGKNYADESSQLHELIQAYDPGATRLLDVACGTGAHLAQLRQWYSVAGVDLDPSMLAVARRRLPDVELVEADMRTLNLGRTFDAVVCLFSSIGYMPSVGDLDLAVAAMARHLEPNGVLVIDGWIRPDEWRGRGSTAIDSAEREDIKVVRVARSERIGSTTHLEMHHLIASDDGVDYLVDHHDLTLFAPGDYEDAFSKAGLNVNVIESPMLGRDRYIGTKPSPTIEDE
jgi:SAM-dependent methyltransferase